MKKSNITIIIGIIVLFFLLSCRNKISEIKTDLSIKDTSVIDEIRFYPKEENSQEIRLKKKEIGWTVSKDKITGRADKKVVSSILEAISNLKVLEIMTKKKEPKDEFKTNDTAAIRVIIFSKDGELLNFYVGRAYFKQNKSEDGGGVSGMNCVRLNGDETVYKVPGFLTFLFNQTFNRYRYSELTNINPDKITKLTFTYPADSGFVMQKQNSIWKIENINADSVKIKKYILRTSNLHNSFIVDDFRQTKPVDFLLKIEGTDFKSVEIECTADFEYNDYVITSTYNPPVFISSRKNGFFNEIFKSKKYFVFQNANK
jgi:hypothetical protein